MEFQVSMFKISQLAQLIINFLYQVNIKYLLIKSNLNFLKTSAAANVLRKFNIWYMLVKYS